LKTNANLNVEGSVISAAIIRAAPRFSRARFFVFFNFTATRQKSKRLVQERITAWLQTQTHTSRVWKERDRLHPTIACRTRSD
jgi:hypothetical protein